MPLDTDTWSDKYWEAWSDKYWDSKQVNGAVPICYLGSALRQWIVVTGPEAGNVWCDNRADQNGLRPLKTRTQK